MEIPLTDEVERLEILRKHTNQMRASNRIASDVDLKEIAASTKNFTDHEIYRLVQDAKTTAMSQIHDPKVLYDPEAIKEFKVTRKDFLHALENDIKPQFGIASENLENMLRRGIIIWGQPVTKILEDGMLFVEATKRSCLVSVLIEGLPNSGKTALAAKLAKISDFPCVKICSPNDMVGYTESEKCSHIRKIFDDAYQSMLSCIVVDDVERLLDYFPIGPRYSNLTLQTLLVLLKKQPPQGNKLLILCTSSKREVLEEMEMLSAFTSELHVPNLSHPDHVLAVLEESNIFSNRELPAIAEKMAGKRDFIGIKKLIALIDMVRQIEPQHRAIKFLTKGVTNPNGI